MESPQRDSGMPGTSSLNDDLSYTELSERMPIIDSDLDSQSVNTNGTSWIAASFIVINAALGAGLLEFPKAYHQCGGVVVALLVQAVMLAFAFIALLILAYCSDIARVATYQDMVDTMCGQFWKRVCGICIAIYCFGTCITFLIVIGDQWDIFLYFITNDSEFCLKWYMNRKFLIPVTSVVIILPLCFPRRIDFLKHASAVGVFSIIYVSILVTVKYFIEPTHPGPIRTKPSSWLEIFIVIPTICFGYQCHVSVIPVYSCLRNRNIWNFTKSVSFAILVCGLCYSSVAAFGYLSFGANVKADILLSYQPTPAILAGAVLVAVKIYTTYPILHFCGRSAFESVFLEIASFSPEKIVSGEKKRRYIETIVWFIVTVLLSIFIPNISNVISVLGGLAVVFIMILPGLCWLALAIRKKEEWSKARYGFHLSFAIFFVVLGCFIFGLTTTQALMENASGENNSHKKGVCI